MASFYIFADFLHFFLNPSFNLIFFFLFIYFFPFNSYWPCLKGYYVEDFHNRFLKSSSTILLLLEKQLTLYYILRLYNPIRLTQPAAAI